MRQTLSDKQDALRQRVASRRKSGWTPGATKLTDQDKITIQFMWGEGKATQQQLASMFGVAQSLIHEVVKRSGMTRTNEPAEDRTCAQCGASVRITAHRRLTRKTFCSKACYWAHLHNPAYQRSVWGTKLARQNVRKHFNLSEFNVVHHVDSNDNNNAIVNLWVFARQADHMSYHRGGDAMPIWRGCAKSS